MRKSETPGSETPPYPEESSLGEFLERSTERPEWLGGALRRLDRGMAAPKGHRRAGEGVVGRFRPSGTAGPGFRACRGKGQDVPDRRC